MEKAAAAYRGPRGRGATFKSARVRRGTAVEFPKGINGGRASRSLEERQLVFLLLGKRVILDEISNVPCSIQFHILVF